MEDEYHAEGDPEGVTTRISKLTARMKAAEATAASEKVRADTASASFASATESLRGMASLTDAHATLQAKYDTATAEADTQYSTLEDMVDAGYHSKEDRELAEFYHGKSGSAEPITTWAGTLNAENAPKGLAHLYSGQAPPVVPPVVPPVDPAAPPAPKLPNGSTTVIPPVPPQGEPDHRQISAMSDAEFAEYQKRLPKSDKRRR